MANIAEEIAKRPLIEVVIVGLLLQLCKNAPGIFIGPIGQKDHMFTVVLEWWLVNRVDNQCAVKASLFLKPRLCKQPGFFSFD